MKRVGDVSQLWCEFRFTRTHLELLKSLIAFTYIGGSVIYVGCYDFNSILKYRLHSIWKFIFNDALLIVYNNGSGSLIKIGIKRLVN